MRVIGLTGGIGSGKSLVAGLIREAGIPVVDADRIAREVVAPGTDCATEIAARFGPSYILPDGSIDRKKLGALVFSDPASRAALETITHPRIRAGIDARLAALEAEGHAAAVVEAALLHENARAGRFESVVCVHCGREEQIRRIVRRDGISAEEASERVDAQMDPERKAALSDHVVDNSGTPEETARRLRALLRDLRLAP